MILVKIDMRRQKTYHIQKFLSFFFSYNRTMARSYTFWGSDAWHVPLLYYSLLGKKWYLLYNSIKNFFKSMTGIRFFFFFEIHPTLSSNLENQNGLIYFRTIYFFNQTIRYVFLQIPSGDLKNFSSYNYWPSS